MKKKQKSLPPVFCTECNEVLEEFCFSPEAANLDRLRAAALRCSVTGTKQGRICAKVFIAEDARFSRLFDHPRRRPSPQARRQLHQAILKKIREEAGRDR
jgi:hypothetical protein